MRMATTGLVSFAILVSIHKASPDESKSGLDGEGFITTWLLLAPIPFEGNQSGVQALVNQRIKDEAKLAPKAGDKIKVGGKELVWKEYKAKDYFFDFNDFLGRETEDSVGYAVCYIHAERDMKNLKLMSGSDDQSMIYLNGVEVLKQEEDRELEKDEDIIDVSLNKGVNVLVFKVVNEKADWSGCARFTDQNGTAVNNLKVTTAPK
jgi:hypothetical protein